jgi:hypothetical protein
MARAGDVRVTRGKDSQSIQMGPNGQALPAGSNSFGSAVAQGLGAVANSPATSPTSN